MRIDDDSADRAVAEARAQDKKLQQQQQKRRSDEASTFDKALAGKKAEATVSRSFAERQAASTRSPVKALLARKDLSSVSKLAHAELEEQLDGQRATEQQGEAVLQGRTSAGRRDVDRKTGRTLEAGRGEDQAVNASSGERVQTGERDHEGKSLSRKQDASTDARRQDSRDERSGGATAGRATATPGKVTAREHKGEQEGQGKKDSGGQPGSFRLPPSALMAPPPLAVPKEAPQLSRLRALAQEIAEKIVKAARVGVNKLGLPEFQMELKSDILQGLKVKVSGRHGRIRAHFSSRDPKVLKQLRGEIDGLRAALSARGLKVDALEIEEERA
jgi:hypothetical protein